MWCGGRSSEDRVSIRALLSLDIKICHRGRESTHQFLSSLKVGLMGRVFPVPMAAPGTSSGFKSTRPFIYLQPVSHAPFSDPLLVHLGRPRRGIALVLFETSWTTGKRCMSLEKPRFKSKPSLLSSLWPYIRHFSTQMFFLHMCGGKNKTRGHCTNFAVVNNINHHLLGTCYMPCPVQDASCTLSCLSSFCPHSSIRVGISSPI